MPKDADLVVFLASYAAFVELVDTVKAWNLLEAGQVEGVFSDLGRHHGINPGLPASYQADGLTLTDGVAIGLLKGDWFAIVKVSDKDAFESFLDTFINEEFGRPRPHLTQYAGVELRNIHVLKRDLVTIAIIDDYYYMVLGERLGSKLPSVEVMQGLLDTQPGEFLSDTPSFSGLADRIGSLGLAMLYSPDGEVAKGFFKPMAAGNPKTEAVVEDALAAGIDGFALALSVEGNEVQLRSFTAIPEERLQAILKVVTPAQDGAGDLSRFVGPNVRGLVRTTFAPEQLETALIGALGEETGKSWEKIKSAASVRFVMNFEDEVVRNLAGELVVVLYGLDEDALGVGAEALDVLDGVQAAIYLPFTDKNKANGYFGKINTVKGLLPKGKVEVEERDGVMVATVRHRRRALLRIAYYDGTLAVCTGEKTIALVIARLKGESNGDTEPRWRELLQGEALWGAAFDMEEVVTFLSARFDIVRVQIIRFLAPLEHTSLMLRFSSDGVGMDFRIKMRPPVEAE